MKTLFRQRKLSPVVGVLIVAVPTMVLAGSILTPPATVTGSSATPVFKAVNNGTGTALQGTATSGFGLFASTYSASGDAIRAANLATTGGIAISASAVGNTIVADSKIGNGVVGSTVFNSTGTKAATGIRGLDLSTSGTANAGIWGSSTNGAGVLASSINGAGLNATSNKGPGIMGNSGSGTGVVAFSVDGTAMTASSNTGDGLAINTSQGRGILVSTQTGDGITISSNDGVGLQVGSEYGVGANINASGAASSIGLVVQSNGINAPSIVANAGGVAATFSSGDTAAVAGESYNLPAASFTETGPNSIIDGFGQTCSTTQKNKVAALDNQGNLVLCGNLIQNGSPQSITRTSTGPTVLTYTPRQAQATIEDVGQAQLVGGQAYVAIDKAFAATIDQRANYLVFITPDGDSRGLYTMRKSVGGFLVRENQNGHSTLTFDYRIVAKPLDTSNARLPLAVASRSYQILLRPQPRPRSIKSILSAHKRSTLNTR